MHYKAARVKKLGYFTKLDKSFRSELHWWHVFINAWNGHSFLHVIDHQATANCHINTDASGSWGCGGLFGEKWLQYAWTGEWLNLNNMAKE